MTAMTCPTESPKHRGRPSLVDDVSSLIAEKATEAKFLAGIAAAVVLVVLLGWSLPAAAAIAGAYVGHRVAVDRQRWRVNPTPVAHSPRTDRPERVATDTACEEAIRRLRDDCEER
jgi:hypothetical protein